MKVGLELSKGEEAIAPRPEGDPMREQYEQSENLVEEEPMSQLAAHITNQWEINRRDKERIETELLALQEAVNGQYDVTTLAEIREISGSEIFIPLTSMQCNAGASWLLSVLLPPGDKAFTFKPTAIPELPGSLQARIEKEVKQKLLEESPKAEGSQSVINPDGLPAGPDGSTLTPPDVNKITDLEVDRTRKEVNKESIKRAERMEEKVNDQLQQSGWFQTLEDFVVDLMTFHTAFIKTVYANKVRMATTVVDGQITLQREESLEAKDERVSPFDIFPSPDQTTVHDGSMIERLKLSKKEIHGFIGKPGFDEDEILSVLSESNTSSFIEWMSNVDSSRRYSENHSTGIYENDTSIYGLRFNGPVSVETLLDWGYKKSTLIKQGIIEKSKGEIKDIDLYREIEIDAILIGRHVIKATPNLDPEGKRLYYSASYRKVPGSFWGKSVAILSTPHQRMVNATARALSNNMGIASGPQIMVYVDRLPNGEALQAIYPLKQWQVVSDPQCGSTKPVEFFQPSSNAKELMAVFQYYFDNVGEVTGIPRTSYASDPTRSMPGANTATGLAMLMETASKQIKQAVRNVDVGVIESRIYYQYRTNMMDPEIPNSYKGDMQAVAIGAKSMVSKAVENQRSIELLQATANPLDSELLGKRGRAAIYKSISRNYDIPDLIPSQDELDKAEKAESQQEKPPSPEQTKLEIEKIRADTRLKDQELENKNAEAQRQLDLRIAEMELEAKKMDFQARIQQNQDSAQGKIQQIALKEKNSNARFEREMVAKDETGSGI